MQDDSGHNTGGYERSDAQPLKLMAIGLISVLLLAGFVVGLDQLFVSMRESMTWDMVLRPESPELREVRVREELLLNSYAMVDSAQGVVRIPIGRAMELQAREAELGRRVDESTSR